jgi:hypothetical protein
MAAVIHEKDLLPIEFPAPMDPEKVGMLRGDLSFKYNTRAMNADQDTFMQVTWDGPDDIQNPLNWSSSSKTSTTVLMSLGQLVTLMSTSMMVAALPQIGEDLGMSAPRLKYRFPSTCWDWHLRRSSLGHAAKSSGGSL